MLNLPIVNEGINLKGPSDNYKIFKMRPGSKNKASFFHFRGDKITLIIVIALTCISIIAVFSATGKEVLGHLVHIFVCYLGLMVVYFIDYRKASRFSTLALLAAIVLIIVTLLSDAVRGVRVAGVTIQTFYLIGFLYIFFIAKYLAVRINHNLPLGIKEMIVLFGTLFFFCGLMAIINMSTAIILFITGLVIFYVGNVKIRYILGAVVCASLIVGLALNTGIGRMETFKNRWNYYITHDNTNGYGDQMILSKAAIARSGLHPTGPGHGVIKYRLPQNETDYVFASLFEETGLIVGLFVIFCYLVLIYRARIISREASGAFGTLLAFGIGFWFTCQAFVHIGVNCELLPATGQTLPFISSGGASLFISGCAVGILLNISKVNAIVKETEDPMEYFH